MTNLKIVKNHNLGFMFGIESNRIVSLQKGSWQRVATLDTPENGLSVWLKNFGQVKVFRKSLKDQQHHYIIYLPNESLQTFIIATKQCYFQKILDRFLKVIGIVYEVLSK